MSEAVPAPTPGPSRRYLVAICAVLSPVLAAAAGVVPSPYGWILAGLALLVGAGSGLVSKVPAFLVGRPLVAASLIVPLLSMAGVLVDQAMASPEGWGRAALLAVAVVCSGLAGKPLPMPGAGAVRAAAPLALFLVAVLSQGCSTLGPRRATVKEVLEPRAEHVSLAAAEPAASPFSAGLMLGAAVPVKGGRLLPAQLAVGALKLGSVGPRSVNLLAFGGLSGTSVSEARGAWGGGVGFELTPGNLLYEVNAGVGPLWVTGVDGPAVLFGFTIQPKM